jgi:hypothetical protein
MFLGLGFRHLLRFQVPLTSEESPRNSLLRATDVHLEGLEVSHHELGARQPYQNGGKCCQQQDDVRAAEWNWDVPSSVVRNLAGTVEVGMLELRKPAPPAAAKVWVPVSAASACSRGSGARGRRGAGRRLRPGGTRCRSGARPAPGPAHLRPRLLVRHSRPTAAAGAASSACSYPTAAAAAPTCPSHRRRRWSRRRARAAAPARPSHQKLLGEGQVEQRWWRTGARARVCRSSGHTLTGSPRTSPGHPVSTNGRPTTQLANPLGNDPHLAQGQIDGWADGKKKSGWMGLLISQRKSFFHMKNYRIVSAWQ